MMAANSAPKRQASGFLRARCSIYSNHQTAGPKRQMGIALLGLRVGRWLLGRCVSRFLRTIPGPKSHQSTSIGGVLSANGRSGDWKFEWKLRGQNRESVVRAPRGGDGYAKGAE
jgi:hypothetical protein